MAEEATVNEHLGASAPGGLISSTGAKMAALAVAQGATFSFPVVFAVVCARNLGPSHYGVVAFYTALTAFLCMFIEFGFDSIGVREVHSSSRRAHPDQVLWNVTIAKLIICLPTCALVAPVVLATRSAAESWMSFAMVFYMIAFALEPSWYLRSLEMMWSVMVAAVVSRTAGILVLVKSVTTQDDLTQAMWTYSLVAWASSVLGWLAIRHQRPLGRPRVDVHHLRALFKSGAAIVVGNLSGASSAGIVVLGAIADPVVTGAANMALRIRAAGLAVLVPLGQFGYVRLSNLVGTDRLAAVGLGRRLFYILMACTVTISLLMITQADRIAAFAYGMPQAPEAAVMLVRLLAVGLPACVAGELFGLHSLTLFQEERAYVLISVIGAAIFFGVLLSFSATTSVFGWAMLTADLWVAMAAGLRLRSVVRSRTPAA